MQEFSSPALIKNAVVNAQHRFLRLRLWLKLMMSLLLTGCAFTLYAWLESIFYLDASIKSLLVGLSILSGVSAFILKITRGKKDNFTDFYRSLADQIQLPELKYYFDIKFKKDAQALDGYAQEQLLNSLEKNGVLQRIQEFSHAREERRQLRQLSAIFLGVCFLLILPLWASERCFERVLRFWDTYQKPNPFQFTVTPGAVRTEQGDFISIQVQFFGELPQRLHVDYKTSIESDYRILPLVKQDSVFITEALQLNMDAVYRIYMDDFYSEEFPIQVLSLPRFDSLLIQFKPPTYTKLKESTQRYPIRSLVIPIGSELTLAGYPNKDLISVKLNKGDQIQELSKRESKWEITYPVLSSDSIRFELRDEYGLMNKNPYEMIIQVQDDAYPTVRLIEPEPIVKLINPDTLSLVFESGDDYGISKTVLHWQVKRLFSREPELNSKRIRAQQQSGFSRFLWDLKQLQLQPQDELTYWIQVWDNDTINGNKFTNSAKHVIKVPSLTDQFLGEQVTETQIDEIFSEVDERLQQMDKQYQEFLEKLAENPNKVTENQRKLDEVKAQQEKMRAKIEEINQQFEKLKNQMDEAGQLSEETREAYEAFQKLVKEIKDDEFLKALEELQKALNAFDQQSIQQALQNIKFDEQKYRDRILRTMELFKKVKLNADLDRLQKSLEQLSAKQESLANDSTSSNEQVKTMQEQLQKQLEDVMKLSENLDKNPPEQLKKSVENLQEELLNTLQETGEEMQEAQEQLERQQRSNAQKKQKSAQQKLKSAQQKVSQFQQKMNQQQESVDRFALESILTQLILLSVTEEQIGLKTDELDYKSNGFVQQARLQQSVNRVFNQIADSLFRVASVNPNFSNTVLEKRIEVQQVLEKSLKTLSERDRQMALVQVRQSLGGINDLASLLVTILEQPSDNNGGGGGGMSPEQMLQQLKDMQGKQQQLNQQLQDMLNDIQGDRLQQSHMERMEQLSKIQNQIRKQLEELQKRGGFEQGDRILSDLQRLAEEMADAINDLRGGRTDRLMIQRQQNILSRMLQAEKALDEREEDEKRKGKQSDKQLRANPPEMTLEELRKKILMQLQNGELTPFSKEYQDLIDLYFKELERRIN